MSQTLSIAIDDRNITLAIVEDHAVAGVPYGHTCRATLTFDIKGNGPDKLDLKESLKLVTMMERVLNEAGYRTQSNYKGGR